MFLPILLKHPLTKENPIKAIARYAKWHFLKLFKKDEFIHTLIGNTRIHLSRHDSAALVNYYTGLYEFEEMCFLLHFLRKKDLLLDAGANIGVFSLMASGHNGAKSFAFEPIPSTFKRLEKNVKLNELTGQITIANIGLGATNTTVKFTNSLENCINRVANEQDTDIVDVNVRRLDDVLISVTAYEAILLKVDVEGFETEVLKGAENLLQNPQLKAIIIELNGSGEKFGFNEDDIKMKLVNEGFELYYYDPFNRLLSKNPGSKSWGNSMYIRDIEFVKNRLTSSKKISILNHSI